MIYLYASWNVRGGLPLLAEPRLRAAALAVLHDLCVEVAAVPVHLAALPDQLHLVVRMPPDHTVPWLVGRCKRRSSRLLLERFPALAETVGRQGLWSVGFHARLLEPAELGATVRYITNGIRRAELHVADAPAARDCDHVAVHERRAVDARSVPGDAGSVPADPMQGRKPIIGARPVRRHPRSGRPEPDETTNTPTPKRDRTPDLSHQRGAPASPVTTPEAPPPSAGSAPPPRARSRASARRPRRRS